jgi:hypothetical protein
MNKEERKKKQERQFIEIFKEVFDGFPDGELIQDDKPDFRVVTVQGEIGIEVTQINIKELKQTESETQKLISEAIKIYEAKNLPKLCVGIHFSGQPVFRKTNRVSMAAKLANLIALNIPDEKCTVTIENDWNDSQSFPYEFEAVDILRMPKSKRNLWQGGSFGFFHENFIKKLEAIVSRKESELVGYCSSCIAQWLLIVSENNSPSTFFNPSERTLAPRYNSSFNKVFFLNLPAKKIFNINTQPILARE